MPIALRLAPLLSAVFAGVVVAQTVATTLPTLDRAAPGDVVRLPIASIDDVPTLPAIVKPIDGPPLIFSDGPEYFPGDGIALRETLPAGRSRVMLYHCPEATGKPKTISAVIENRGETPVSVRFVRYSSPTPGLDYLKIGRQAMREYFSDAKGPPERTIPPGGRILLDDALDKAVVTKDELVHTFHELELSGPATLIVFQREPSADSLTAIDGFATLPPRNHGAGRGTFADANRSVTLAAPVDTVDGPRQVVVADGKTDPWTVGRDAIEGTPSVDKGNYGVVYHITFDVRSGDGRRMAVLLAKPQPDEGYCPATAASVAIRIGDAPASVVGVPRAGVLKRFPQAGLIGIVAPGREQTTRVELTYTPPAASCLPTPIVVVPME